MILTTRGATDTDRRVSTPQPILTSGDRVRLSYLGVWSIVAWPVRGKQTQLLQTKADGHERWSSGDDHGTASLHSRLRRHCDQTIDSD